MRISFSDVQRNVTELANRQEYTKDILFELMAAYGRSASSITKLRNGLNNLAEDKEDTVLQRQVVYFKVVNEYDSLPAEVEKLEQDPLTQRYNPRFLIATDLKTFAAKDTKKGNTLEIEWADIDRNVDFFYGWTGDEVTDEKTEAAADRRAADKMKELYQEVEKINIDKFKDKSSNYRHHLNVFFTRLLFCLFAEDTRVFSKTDDNIFTGAIKDFTQPDGSDLDEFLTTLFDSLDNEDKSSYTSPFSKFPYVNGRLFDKSFGIEVPEFNAQARKLILDCGALSWAEINPDIFGSMFQSIVDEEHRSTHGMHYTSVPNIMKTIEPLFLDELREEFDKNFDNPKKLQKLWDRISKIKVFDPACGSGNFLIIAYKELRKLEHGIIERIFEDDYKASMLKNKLQSQISLDNFYGIEIDDFPVEVAILSLYLAKHQMNIEFEKQFGKEIKLIPLKDKANVVQANAAQIDWQKICPNVPVKHSLVTENQEQLIVTEKDTDHLLVAEEWEEIYLIGNPPYLGSSLQSKLQKIDMEQVFRGFDNYKNLDYISIWFKKGTDYISEGRAELAFVSTNSIVQGEQVGLLWPYIQKEQKEIGFAFTSFKWKNSARNNAGVTCVVINIRNKSKKTKYIYDGILKTEAQNINSYLADADEVIVEKRRSPLSKIPSMGYGCKPVDGGHLILSPDEYQSVTNLYGGVAKYIKKFASGQDYISNKTRYCYWIDDESLSDALQYDDIKDRIEKVRTFRLDSKDSGAQKMAERPHQFREFILPSRNSLIVPSTTSERREYLPMGYLDGKTVPNNASFVIHECPEWVFALISSRMHMTWIRAVSGRLKTDIRYSSSITYNTFPLQTLTKDEESSINKSAREILFARENHTEKTLAEMYDPDKMPEDLREAHHKNDILVDRLYRQKPYDNDEERLSDLFDLYEEMTRNEEK